jgi:hypothetical protein
LPYKPAPTAFRDASGEEIDVYQEALNEPTSPAVEDLGAEIELRFTPTGAPGERYIAGHAAGPAGHARVDISDDDGDTWTDAADGLAVGTAGVEQTIMLRGAGLAFTGNDSDVSTFQAGVASSGEADWLG